MTVETDDHVALVQARAVGGAAGLDGDDEDAALGRQVVLCTSRAGSGTVWTETPIWLRLTRPSRIRRPATYFAVLMAIAKQIPCAGRMMAVLTPMTCPASRRAGRRSCPGSAPRRSG